MSKLKRVVAYAIGYTPIGRVAMYRLLGYRIGKGSRIGFGSVINARRVSIGRNVHIGPFNQFTGRLDLVVGDNVNIGASNEITCVSKAQDARFEIQEHGHFSKGHFFDASGGIIIGPYTRIAGRGSQFWTHGGQRKRRDILIGSKCYIGSGSKFSQGVTLADNCFVGLGSVVTHSFTRAGDLISAPRAEVVKHNVTARLSLVREIEGEFVSTRLAPTASSRN